MICITNYNFKIVLIGDGAVGKTTIRRRYMGESFRTNYMMTIGGDFTTKKISHSKGEITLQIWDLSGHVGFNNVRRLFYKNTDGLIVVYDVSERMSLDHCEDWIDEYVNSGYKFPVPIIIVGNKTDLLEEPLKEKFSNFKKALETKIKYKVNYQFTSALKGENIELIFQMLTDELLKKKE